MYVEDLIGKKFGYLTVVSRAESVVSGKLKKKRGRWLCVCDCGTKIIVQTTPLKSGHTKSCGCFRQEVSGRRRGVAVTHGHFVNNKPTKLYSTWQGIKERCLNENSKDYYRYGGRGITICTRWQDSFENFVSDMGEPEFKHLQVDRINTNGPYSKENCRWVDAKTNNNNRRICIQVRKQKTCKHVLRQESFEYCPSCGISFAEVELMTPTNPDGSKAGVVNG